MVDTHTLTGNFPALIGGQPQRISAAVRTNSADGGWVNPDDGTIVLGGAAIRVSPTGTFSVELPTSTGTGLAYEVVVTYIDPEKARRRGQDGQSSWSSGEFQLTADADLADLANDSTLRVTPSMAEVLAGRIDELEENVGTGSSGSLIVVGGGSIDLDNTKADGFLVGYKVTAETLIEGATFGVGSYIFERDSGVTSGWTYRTIDAGSPLAGEGDDTTAPTVGTLASSGITDTGFTLTVTGASDDTALAAAPYSFSTDNGATWSAYQSSAALAVTGKTASTAYQCRHRVKDAAGNVSTGTAITVNTSAADIAPGWTVADAFTASDGTNVVGRVTTKGAKTWISGDSMSRGGAPTDAVISSNAVINTDATISTFEAAIAMGSANNEISVQYDLTTGTAGTNERRAYLFINGVDSSDVISVQIRADGSLLAFKGDLSAVALAGTTTGVPQSGTFTVKILGTTLTITHPAGSANATLATGSGYSGTGTKVGFGVREDGSKIDLFRARVAA